MGRDHVANLITATFQPDALGQMVPTESKREIFCEISGIRQSEWFSAGQTGLKPQLMLTVFPDDYDGETQVEVDGVRYGIYRTYPAKHDRLELYLEKKGGI